MATSQKFGGNWTEEKLNIFTSYLDAYLIALQNKKIDSDSELEEDATIRNFRIVQTEGSR